MTHEKTAIPASSADSEQAKFWHANDIGRLELLKARYVSHTFPRHVHEEYVIGVIEAGVEAFYTGGGVHTAPAGSIVLINPDTVHTGHAGDKTGWTYRTLYPARGLITGIAAQMADRPVAPPYFPNPVIRDVRLARLIRRLHMTLETSASAIERESLFIHTMSRLIDRHAQNRPVIKKAAGDQRAVRQVKDYIAAHFQENISLRRMAARVCLSPYYLTRLFTPGHRATAPHLSDPGAHRPCPASAAAPAPPLRRCRGCGFYRPESPDLPLQAHRGHHAGKIHRPIAVISRGLSVGSEHSTRQGHGACLAFIRISGRREIRSRPQDKAAVWSELTHPG